MDYTSPEPMVYSTNLAHWPPALVGQVVGLTASINYPDGFKPIREWPVFGLRPNELAALRFIHREGPMAREVFHRRFKRSTPKGRAAILHDLNRLGLIRLVLGIDPDGKESIVIQAAGPVDFDELERTVCPC